MGLPIDASRLMGRTVHGRISGVTGWKFESISPNIGSSWGPIFRPQRMPAPQFRTSLALLAVFRSTVQTSFRAKTPLTRRPRPRPGEPIGLLDKSQVRRVRYIPGLGVE